MERTIRVTGTGKLSISPDTMQVIITLKNVKKTYEQASDEVTTATQKCKKILGECGIAETDIKTEYFNIRQEKESVQDKFGRWTEKSVGYSYEHRVRVEFLNDNARLNKIIKCLSDSKLSLNFDLRFTLADKEFYKNKLLAEAVKNSTTKAKALAEAAGVKLGDVVTINYSWDDMDLSVAPMARAYKMDYVMAITPDDIEIEDTVTVVWEIV